MKSSSIALLHVPRDDKGRPWRTRPEVYRQPDRLAGSRGLLQRGEQRRLTLADRALLVVDAIEGVCVQTHAVVRRRCRRRVKLCLVINKIDRLIGELKFSPIKAYADRHHRARREQRCELAAS